MELRFTKMHGLGNDFMVVDAIGQRLPEQDSPLPAATIRQLADRHFGIGFDQLLVVQPAQGDADFRYRIFNADGGEVNQCGNGARCFARFVREQGLTDKRLIRVETAAGEMTLEVQADGQVTVNMGEPRWTPEQIPFNRRQEADSYLVRVGDHTWEISAVGLGNPHAVMVVEDVDQTPVESLGPLLESHPDFPERVNVGFMEVVARDHVRLRVFERGSGETLACGSGACAAMLCGRRRGLLGNDVRVTLRGGELRIQHDGSDGVLMTGPAEHVYDGRITIGGKDA